MPALAAAPPLFSAFASCTLALFASLHLDANPTLYLYSSLLLTDRRLTSHWTGRKVWLVGASSGIGAELAVLLAGHGAEVVLSGRDGEKLEEVAERCRREVGERSGSSSSRGRGRISRSAKGKDGGEKGRANNGGKVVTLPLDVTAPHRTLTEATDLAISALGGRIDVLILNSGRGQLLPAVQTPEPITRELMEANFHGPVRLANSVMERGRWGQKSHVVEEGDAGAENDGRRRRRRHPPSRARNGHIVVTSSVLGKMAGPLSSSYVAAKHAVHGYFATLRAECSPWLRVDLPCPGPVDTPFGRRALSASLTTAAVTAAGAQTAENGGAGGGGGGGTESECAGSSRAKLPPARCARLILASMTGPESLFHETWISRQPTLGFAYLAQHLPGLANALLNRMGPLRQLVWEAGLPLYESGSFRKVAAERRRRERRSQQPLRRIEKKSD